MVHFLCAGLESTDQHEIINPFTMMPRPAIPDQPGFDFLISTTRESAQHVFNCGGYKAFPRGDTSATIRINIEDIEHVLILCNVHLEYNIIQLLTSYLFKILTPVLRLLPVPSGSSASVLGGRVGFFGNLCE